MPWLLSGLFATDRGPFSGQRASGRTQRCGRRIDGLLLELCGPASLLCALRSDDTDARNDILDCVGRGEDVQSGSVRARRWSRSGARIRGEAEHQLGRNIAAVGRDPVRFPEPAPPRTPPTAARDPDYLTHPPGGSQAGCSARLCGAVATSTIRMIGQGGMAVETPRTRNRGGR
jgi:hypothetical protein